MAIFARTRERQGFSQDVNALQQFALNQQRLRLAGGLPGDLIFPTPRSTAGADLFGNFLLQRQQQQGAQALQAAKPLPRETESQFTAFLGNKISTGTATQEEKDLFERLTATPSTVINLGTPSPTERTAIAKTRASVDALDNLKTLFDNPNTRTGPIVGRIDPIKGTFGFTSDEQEDFMAATSAFRNKIIEEITGAQMSEIEAVRILKQVPQEIDPPKRWEAKWRQSKKNLEFLQKRRLEILEQSGLRVPGQTPTKPQRKPIDVPPPPAQGSVPNISMQQFQQDFGAWQRTTNPKIWTKLPRNITSKIKEALSLQVRWTDIVQAEDVKAALARIK